MQSGRPAEGTGKSKRIRSSSLIASMLVLGTLVTVTPPGMQPAIARPSVTVTDLQVNPMSAGLPPTQANMEPTIAQNPTDPLNLIVGAFDLVDVPPCTDTTPSICPKAHLIPQPGLGFFASFDGGKTFACHGDVDFSSVGAPARYDPWVAFDSRGNAYLAGLGFAYPPPPGQPGKGEGLFITKSSDGGCTWSAAARVSGDGLGQFADKDSIAVDASAASRFRDNIYATWLKGTRTQGRSIMLSRSTDGGVTWSNAVPVAPSGEDIVFRTNSLIEVAPDGTIYVVWIEDVLDRLLIKASISYDGGKTFPKKGILVAPYATEDIYGALPGTQLGTWGPTSFSLAPDGTLYVSFTRRTADHTVVMLAKSTDGGLKWLTEAVADIAGRSAFMATVAADPNGKVNVAFNALDDLPPGTPLGAGVAHYDTYWVQSTDGGVTFSRPLKISSAPSDPDVSVFPYYFPDSSYQFVGDYVSAVADSSHVYTVWTDTRNGSPCPAMDDFLLGQGPAPDLITQCSADWDNADIYLGTVSY
jgi:hypothetical protein